MRFLKNLFSVPKGKKVTEADMKRVLVSSVCGILLCMTCLISSTWAWYTVSMETAAFTIDVADAKLAIEVNGAQADGTSVVLTPAVETVVDVTFTPAQTPDALNVTPQRYIIMTVIDEQEQPLGTYYVACKGDVTQVKLLTDAACTVYFTPAWPSPPQPRLQRPVFLQPPQSPNPQNPAPQSRRSLSLWRACPRSPLRLRTRRVIFSVKKKSFAVPSLRRVAQRTFLLHGDGE